MNLQHEITAYLHYSQYQKKLNAKTIKAYSIDLAQFEHYFNTRSESNITKSTISEYIIGLHQSYLPQTVKRKLASLRAFLNHLEFEEILETNPIRKIKTKFQEPKALPKTIPLSIIKNLLAAAYQDKELATTEHRAFVALRNVAVIEMLFATGMRISELCSLKNENVNLDDGTVLIMGKGSKERIIQIVNGNVLAVLRQYANSDISHIRQSRYFFINRFGSRLSEQSVRFVLAKLKKEAGVSLHITPHMFRHSFATLLLEEDVDIRYIQQMLGHSSIKTTQIYAQVTTKKQRQILTAKHPRSKIYVE